MVSDFLQNPLKKMLRVIQANAIRAEIRCACAMTPIFQSPQYSTIAERPTVSSFLLTLDNLCGTQKESTIFQGKNQNSESTMHKIYEKTTEVIKDAGEEHRHSECLNMRLELS
jgi:hypothetical protein